MVFLGIILSAVAAYFLGSIPTGFLVAKARGVDIRKVGSGNIGATNVLRSLGKPAGIFVLLMDALKGLLAVVVAEKLLAPIFTTSPLGAEWCALVSAVFAVLGHNYTCWLGFKGGKGIATSAGVLLGLVPWSLLIIFVVWVLVFGATRFVSLASICASATLPFAAWFTGESLTMIVITTLMAVLAIGKHHANIRRLLQGTEHRIGSKPQSASSTNHHA